jgi:anti-anti-sigma factor
MQITSRSLNGTALLEISEDIDHSTAEEFHTTAMHALGGKDRLILDLTSCRYVDSGGVAVVLALPREGGPDGLLGIVGGSRNLMRLFSLVGLDAEPRVRLYPDIGAAESDVAVSGH